MNRRLVIIATTLVAAAALVVPATGQAAVTIGSDLTPDPTLGDSCSPSTEACTVANTALPGQQLTSPISGVVTRWRVRASDTDVGGNTARLRVIRPASGGTYTGVSTGPIETVVLSGPPPQTFTFSTQQPIQEGDLVGLDVDPPSGNFDIHTGPQAGVTRARWQPPLPNGISLLPTDTSSSSEVLLNADVEPDCDQDGLGDETQDPDTSSCAPPSPQVAQCNGKQPTILGTPGNDVLTGTHKKDVIAALGGDDQVKGKTAKDAICGGEGNDLLKGGKAKDALNGEPGDDTLRGGRAKDALNGGDGTDTCNGGRGKDTGSSCEATTKIP